MSSCRVLNELKSLCVYLMPEAKLKLEAILKGMCGCNKPAALVPSSAGHVRAVARNRANLVAAVMNFGSVHSLIHL